MDQTRVVPVGHLVSYHGRIYLSKDAFTLPDQFQAMESRLDAWNRVRRKWDPRQDLRSRQSTRLWGNAE